MTQLEFLSTLSLRRATNYADCDGQTLRISIHALLAESDGQRALMTRALRISIHALLAESDIARRGLCKVGIHFYPRSPCGERL